MPAFNRRDFLRASGLTLIPAILPVLPALAKTPNPQQIPPGNQTIKFYGDGEMFDLPEYLDQLQQANARQPIKVDRYGSGGAVTELENKFKEITGKEKAMYMPTGTMANQLAIAVLSGDNTKVFVQDTSHVFRDEADSAQSVFGKRLIPLAKDEPWFTADTLKQAVEALDNEEAFNSGIGCVSIENPVRRGNGRMVPIEEIKKISNYCRDNNIKLHLDGARIYMASAWSGISIKEYAGYFDTIYISLYKYLGASGGAILCGDKKVMDKMQHLVKIHGGNMFGNWLNAAMALHRLDGMEERLLLAKKKAVEIFQILNALPGIKITPLEWGTNIYNMTLGARIKKDKFAAHLAANYFIRIPAPAKTGDIKITVNETLLYQDAKYIADAFKDALQIAGG